MLMYTHLFKIYSEQFFNTSHCFCPILYFMLNFTLIQIICGYEHGVFKNLIYILLPPHPPVLCVKYFTQIFFVNHLHHSHYSLDLSPCTCKLGSWCFIASTVLKGNEINQINKKKKRNYCPESFFLEATNNMCSSYKLHVQQWIMEHFKHAPLTPCIKWDLEG